MNIEKVTAALMGMGFEWNTYTDAIDRGRYRVYFADGDTVVVKFTDLRTRAVEWTVNVGAGMPESDVVDSVDFLTTMQEDAA